MQSKLSVRSKFGFLILLFAFALFSLPLAADAAWWDPSTWGEELAEFIVKLIVTAITAIPAFVFFLVAGVTNWFIHLVMNIGVAPCSTPPCSTPTFVADGWNFSRQFVNMFFLLILVFIGLATILRLREYELQKTLPKLILIALLVNFSGVFVGFIVDIGNLLTNFFISETGEFGSGTFEQIYTTGDNYIDGLVSQGDNLLAIFVKGVVYGLVMWLFYAISALAYFAVFLIFFLRQIILWVIVILAPIAFAAYILPATRSWWTRWFSSLTQWAFVGVPIGFFLWLSNKVMIGPEIYDKGKKLVLESDLNIMQEIIVTMLLPFTGIVLLLVGISLSLSMAPSSVRGVMKFGRTAAAVGVGVLGAQVVSRYFAKEKRERESGKDTLMSKAERMNFGIDWKNKKLKSLAVGVGTLGVAPLARFGLRTGIRKGVEYGAKQGEDIEKKAKDLESIARRDWGLFMERSKASGLGFLGDQNRAAAVLAAARVRGGRGLNALQGQNAADFESGLKHLAAEKPGKLGDVLKHNFDLTNDTKAEEIFGPQRGKAMATMLRERSMGDSVTKDASGHTVLTRDRDQNIEDRDVRAILELDRVKRTIAEMAAQGKGQWEQDQYLIQEAVSKKLADDIKNTDIDSMSARMLDNPEFRRAIGQWKPWSFIRKVGEEWGSEAIEKIQDEMQAIDPDLKDLAKTNKSFLRAATTRDGNMIMKHWKRADGTDIEEEKDMKAYIKELTTAAPTSPLIQSYENTYLDDEALRRSNRDPSKDYLEHRKSAENDYMSQYRKPIDARLAEEKDLLQWRIDQGHFADFATAQQTRWQEILGQLQREKTLPRLTPKATKQEELQFKEIAQNPTAAPSKNTRQAFRLVTGAKEAAHYILKEREKEMTRIASELTRSRDELAKPLLDPRRARELTVEIPGLEAKLLSLDTDRATAQATLGTLDARENILKRLYTTP